MNEQELIKRSLELLGWDYITPLIPVRESFLALVCESKPEAGIEPRALAYSGVAVEIEGRTIWLTAAHGIDKINRWHDLDPNLETRFVLAAGGGGAMITFDPTSIEVLQIPAIAKKMVGENLGADDEFFEALSHLMKIDAAFAILPPSLAGELHDAGLVAMPRNSTRSYESDEALDLVKEGFQYFVSGVPSSSYTCDGQLLSDKCTFRSLAIAPSDNQPGLPVLIFEPQWPEEEFQGSMAGMSGGSVCAVTPAGAFFLEGLQFFEVIENGRHTEIRAVYVGAILDMIEMALQ